MSKITDVPRGPAPPAAVRKADTSIMRMAAAAAVAALTALGVSGGGASAAATHARQARAPSWATSHAAAPRGAQLWVTRYNGPGDSFDAAIAVVVSPGGDKVFVTGKSEGATSGPDYATIAYSTATGARLWAARYNGPSNGYEAPASMAISPTGRTVYVTGASGGDYFGQQGQDYATIAYNAATGARLWAARYNGPANSYDAATSVAVSPSGGMVFVTGGSIRAAASQRDYTTIAYNAATGAQLWLARYNGPGNGDDVAAALTVSPGGRQVFVTGSSPGRTSTYDYATIAYKAATGAQVWVKRYNGPANSYDQGTDVAVSPAGNTVFVTGHSAAAASGDDYATIAYNAATGTWLWAARYSGPGNRGDSASAVTVGPGGGVVYVTGSSGGATSWSDYATVAYRAATGAQVWVKRYNGPGNSEDVATAIALSPDGGTVYVTGSSAGITPGEDYATVAYRTATGSRLWVGRYDGPAHRDDLDFSVAVSPRDGKVFVTGESMRVISDNPYQVMDYATIAYHG